MTEPNSKRPKVSLKPFRQVGFNDAEKLNMMIQDGIQTIYEKESSSLSFEELYRYSYNLVLHHNGKLLYTSTEKTIDEHLKKVRNEDLQPTSDDKFLAKYIKIWDEHRLTILMIRDILMYMDRVYVVKESELTLYEKGLQLFRNDIMTYEISSKLCRLLLENIDRRRSGESIISSHIINSVKILEDLGDIPSDSIRPSLAERSKIYCNEFENMFLDTSENFYRNTSYGLLVSNSCPDYLRRIELFFEDEQTWVTSHLDDPRNNTETKTLPKIRTLLNNECLLVHLRSLIEMENSGLIILIRDDQYDDLKRMYQLFSRVEEGLPLIRDVLGEFLLETGKNIIKNDESPVSYIKSLLDLKDKYDQIISRSFNSDSFFIKRISQEFEKFINLNNKSPEYLSLFVDQHLKQGVVSSEESEIILDKIIELYKFIQEKDVFEKYYKQHFAKRLLMGRSISEDAEKIMIGKLKIESGCIFTSKLEGMFNDIRNGETMGSKFKDFLSSVSEKLPLDFSTNILTTGLWPIANVDKCILPLEVSNCCSIFETFYSTLYSGRRISWQSNMGTAELKSQFGSKRHELQVSTMQMCILNLFNDSDYLSVDQIVSGTKISKTGVERSLFPVVKMKILHNKDSGYEFNPNFRSKLFRVKLLATGGAEKKEEVAVTRVNINEERKHQIEAKIVRVMKDRKRLNHNNLISEVTIQLSNRFIPDPLLIKKQIESLIEREYLSRDKDDRRIYEYLA